MPNILVLSLEDFSFSSRQLYEQLLPKLISRAAIHESLTIQDAMNCTPPSLARDIRVLPSP